MAKKAKAQPMSCKNAKGYPRGTGCNQKYNSRKACAPLKECVWTPVVPRK